MLGQVADLSRVGRAEEVEGAEKSWQPARFPKPVMHPC